MGEAAKALATPVPYPFEGETYQVSPLDYDMIGAFEVWIEQQALAGVERHKHRMSAAQYEARLDAVFDRIGGQAYSYGTDLYARAASSQDGNRFIFLLQLKKLSPQADEELVDRMFKLDPGGVLKVQRLADVDPNVGAALAAAKKAQEEADKEEAARLSPKPSPSSPASPGSSGPGKSAA